MLFPQLVLFASPSPLPFCSLPMLCPPFLISRKRRGWCSGGRGRLEAGILRLESFRGVGMGCANPSVPFPPPFFAVFFFGDLIGLVLEPTTRNMMTAMMLAMIPKSWAVANPGPTPQVSSGSCCCCRAVCCCCGCLWGLPSGCCCCCTCPLCPFGLNLRRLLAAKMKTTRRLAIKSWSSASSFFWLSSCKKMLSCISCGCSCPGYWGQGGIVPWNFR